MDNPTEEQIKEIWEWCGFRQEIRDCVGLVMYETPQTIWISPNGQEAWQPPPIDLNNLFRYAMPKVSDKPEVRFRVHWRSKNELTCELWRHSPKPITQVLEASVEFEDKPTEIHYALALFWALQQALKEGVENG